MYVSLNFDMMLEVKVGVCQNLSYWSRSTIEEMYKLGEGIGGTRFVFKISISLHRVESPQDLISAWIIF